MKNVYIIDDYASSKINGIGTYMKELIFCLKDISVNICLIACNHETKTFQIVIEDNITQMQFPAIYGFDCQYYKVIEKFFRLYIEDSPDNFFMFNHTPFDLLIKTVKDFFPLSKLVFVIHDMTWTSAMLGDKVTLQKYAIDENRDLFEKEFPGLFPKFNEEKRMFEAVHQIVVLAPETIELLQNVYRIPKEKISFIPNGLRDTFHHLSENEQTHLKEKLFIPLNEKVIVFAGRVKQVKGIFQIISSLKQVAKTYPDFRLIVVGTIFDVKKIMEHVGEIAAKIIFTGQICSEKLNEWYQIADIGVVASYWEQCSYTGIEMMMYGLSVIASDGFCVGDMFKDDDNAIIAHIGNRSHPEEFENNLSETFLKLLQSDSLCRKMGANGRRIYESKYTINAMKEGYRTLFNSITN